MQKLEYELSFLTPAFLGNAAQAGQWRTPPIKTLIRQWWRMAFVAGQTISPGLVNTLREHEQVLFGTVADSLFCGSIFLRGIPPNI